MTNREVINQMTNEELGQFMDHIDCAQCAYHDHEAKDPDFCHGLNHCPMGIAKWLSQEADWRMQDYIHKPEVKEPDISERERKQYAALIHEVERIREDEAVRSLEGDWE